MSETQPIYEVFSQQDKRQKAAELLGAVVNVRLNFLTPGEIKRIIIYYENVVAIVLSSGDAAEKETQLPYLLKELAGLHWDLVDYYFNECRTDGDTMHFAQEHMLIAADLEVQLKAYAQSTELDAAVLHSDARISWLKEYKSTWAAPHPNSIPESNYTNTGSGVPNTVLSPSAYRLSL